MKNNEPMKWLLTEERPQTIEELCDVLQGIVAAQAETIMDLRRELHWLAELTGKHKDLDKLTHLLNPKDYHTTLAHHFYFTRGCIKFAKSELAQSASLRDAWLDAFTEYFGGSKNREPE